MGKHAKACESIRVFGDVAQDVEVSGIRCISNTGYLPNASTSSAISPNTTLLSHAFPLFLLPSPSVVVHPR